MPDVKRKFVRQQEAHTLSPSKLKSLICLERFSIVRVSADEFRPSTPHEQLRLLLFHTTLHFRLFIVLIVTIYYSSESVCACVWGGGGGYGTLSLLLIII